jgi:hypothetical protein
MTRAHFSASDRVGAVLNHVGQSDNNSDDGVRIPHQVEHGFQHLVGSAASLLAPREEMASFRGAFMDICRICLAQPACFLYVPRRSGMNAVMTKFEIDAENASETRKWDGLAEIDQALRDNRLMEYRIKKSWADPWGRKLTIVGGSLIVAVFAFLIGASLGMW